MDLFYINETNPKIENLLNLALDTSETERQKSKELEVGYIPEENKWELIIKYEGTLDRIRELAPDMTVIELLHGYAVLYVLESFIPVLAEREEITYIEKPKRLFFAIDRSLQDACVSSLRAYESRQGVDLNGQGTIVAVIDSGIDYSHPDFRNEDGTTRIMDLWDQTIEEGPPPLGFMIGTEYSRTVINEALQQTTRAEQEAICPSRDSSGHGTHVTGIAAGNGRASSGQYRGVAPRSELLIVKMGNALMNSFPRTTQLMMAIDYIVRKSIVAKMPVAINISFGNSYGSHSGDSLLETYINDISNSGKSVLVVGSGNEGNANGHTSGVLKNEPGTVVPIEFTVSEYEQSFSIQLWKAYVDEFDVAIKSPAGNVVGPIVQIQGPQRFRLSNTDVLIYYGEPSPYSVYQEIYIDFIPRDSYVNSGIWEIQLFPRKIVTGDYNLWMPGKEVRNPETGFSYPTEETTLTIPSTAANSITVGAYDAIYGQFADFSGRGYTRTTNLVKPDLVAPGVNIVSAAPGGGYVSKTGTSMATPFVTGASALIMQWGIVEGNDPYLYSEKVKAYLIRGARQLTGLESPNPLTGWGALCVRDSLPV